MGDTWFYNSLILAVLIGLIPAAIARSKGHNFAVWWLLGSLLFIVALPVSLILPRNQEVMEQRAITEGGRRCPYCAEVIKREAVVCRYCGRELMPRSVEQVPTSPLDEVMTDIRWEYEPWLRSGGGQGRSSVSRESMLASLQRASDIASEWDSDSKWQLARKIRSECLELTSDSECEQIVLGIEGYARAGLA